MLYIINAYNDGSTPVCHTLVSEYRLPPQFCNQFQGFSLTIFQFQVLRVPRSCGHK